jgi:hypothetical protein
MKMLYSYDDGGRKSAGFKGNVGDCVCRALSILTELPYKHLYDILARFNRVDTGIKTVRRGIYTDTNRFKSLLDIFDIEEVALPEEIF